MKCFLLGNARVVVFIAVFGSSAYAGVPDVRHDLEMLREYSEASLEICSMKAETQSDRLQIGEGGSDTVESLVWRCAKTQEAALQPPLSKVKSDLQANPKAISLLKNWYSAWLATIENISGGGSLVNTTALDDRFNKVVLEATW